MFSRTQSFLMIAAACGAMAAPAAQAQTTDPVAAMLDCDTIVDNGQRLACFDAITRSLRAEAKAKTMAPAAEPMMAEKAAPAAMAEAPAKAAAEAKTFGKRPEKPKQTALADEPEKERRRIQLFGREQASTADIVEAAETPEVVVLDRNDDGDPTKIQLGIVKFQKYGYEKYHFVMSNGQVWSQIDTKRVRLPKTMPKGGVPAEIRTASFGSYFLQIEGKGQAIRVRRTK